MKGDKRMLRMTGPFMSSRVRTDGLLSIVPRCSLLLDIGCASGEVTRLLAERARSVVGIDLYLPARGVCGTPEHLQFVKGDAFKLPFRDESFDCATMFDCIEHFEEPGPALNEVRRILRHGATLAISTPNLDNMNRRLGLRLLLGKPRYPTFPLRLWEFNDGAIGTHYREYTITDLCALLKANGFLPVEIRGDYVGFGLYRKTTAIIGSSVLGRLLPSWSLGLLVRAQKPS